MYYKVDLCAYKWLLSPVPLQMVESRAVVAVDVDLCKITEAAIDGVGQIL